MKKLLGIMLGFSMILSSLVGVHAFDINTVDVVKMQVANMGYGQVQISKTYPLYDVNGDYSYDLYEFIGGGFTIATHENGYISELMMETVNPYYKYDNHDLYYMGPYNYFYKDGNNLKHVSEDVTVGLQNLDIQTLSSLDNDSELSKVRIINNDMLSKKVSMISTYGDNVWRGTASSKFAKYKNWVNTNNTCGPHAAAVILAYSDDNIDDRIVPSSLRSRNSTSAGSLISRLTSNMSNPTSTRPVDVSNGMWSIISMEAGLYYTSSSQTIGSTWSPAVSKIDSFRGCVGVGLVTAFGSPSKYGDHWVVAYQYKEDGNNKGYFMCHDNHGAYTAIVQASWSLGLVWINRK